MCYRNPGMEDTRIDKWLWVARFFKSRSLAAKACTGGKVDVNDQSAKPSRLVHPGDLLKITLPRVRRVVRIVATSERRGPGSAAAVLYDDLTPAPPPREMRAPPPGFRPPGAGRPTKRDRRAMDRLARGHKMA
jgi:ribosome-associated heat shock protein Hsp15